MLVIPALRNLSQEDHEFKASLCCIVRPYLPQKSSRCSVYVVYVYFKNIDSFLLALSGYKELFLFMEARS
jgi:hypothetical protein